LEYDLSALLEVEQVRHLGERGNRSRRDDGRERTL
jgi:transposase